MFTVRLMQVLFVCFEVSCGHHIECRKSLPILNSLRARNNVALLYSIHSKIIAAQTCQKEKINFFYRAHRYHNRQR